MEYDYNSIPPKYIKTIKVKYKDTGRIEPLRYILNKDNQVKD